ncbi:replication protein A 70 kDa DNA-binding subunit B [Tanacetum coccineum]
MFDCTVLIVDESFIDVKEYSERVFANQDVTESENTASRISTASKNSTKESFVSKIPPKNITELLDVAHDSYAKKGVKNLELIIMDEHNTKMQASVRPGLVNQFKNRLEEGKAVTLQRYSLGEIQPKYRMVNKALRLSFLSNTDVEVCNDFTESLYGFDFRSYRSITDLKQEEDSQFELDNYDKNGKAGEKNHSLWWMLTFAQQFSDFLGTCSDHGKIIVVLQLTMMKIWDGKMCVQNGYNGTKLFTFDCTVLIVDESFIDVKEYSESLKNSTKESFVSKIPPKNIAELLDVAQGVTSVIVDTIIVIHEEEGWLYIGCKVCKKKVIGSSDMVDLEAEMPMKKTDVKDDWYCTKCNAVSNIKTIENAYIFPTEITTLVGKRYAFKVSIDEYNAKKLLPVFTVLRLPDDPQIIESIHPMATPTKESEATSSVAPSVNQLDLESQTDENTTPVNTGKISHATSGGKRPAEEDRGSESSNFKKKAVEVKIEKDL